MVTIVAKFNVQSNKKEIFLKHAAQLIKSSRKNYTEKFLHTNPFLFIIYASLFIEYSIKNHISKTQTCSII